MTRKKNLETLFKQSRPEKEKLDDSQNRIATTTQRKGKESEVPVKEVAKLYPNNSVKNITIPLQPVFLQSCRSEQIRPACRDLSNHCAKIMQRYPNYQAN